MISLPCASNLKLKQSYLYGVKSKDALHIACAIEGKAEYFLTTDDKLLKKLAETKELIVINPVNFIPILESM